jgi:excisionase family DNA binding protein
MKLEITDFPDELIQQLAEKLGVRAGSPARTTPYSMGEAAKALGVSRETIRLAVHAGKVRRVPGISAIRIPAVDIERMKEGRN